MRLGRGAQMLALSIIIKDVGCGWLTLRGEGQTPQKRVNMDSEVRLSRQNSVRLVSKGSGSVTNILKMALPTNI